MVKPKCLYVGLLWGMVFVVMSTTFATAGQLPVSSARASRLPVDRNADLLAPVDAATVQALRDFLQAKSSVPITDVKAWQLPERTFIVEVRANLGERWGNRALAKKLAVSLASACFTSQWPLAEVRVIIDTSRFSLLTLNLGRNQADKLFSHQSQGIDSLFREIKLLHNVEGHPADRLWVIEWLATVPAF